MYESFRNELQLQLSYLPENELNKILHSVDVVANDFDFSEKEKHLVPYVTELPQEVKAFMIAKKIEGCSKSTLDVYGIVLTRFFETTRKAPKDIIAMDLRLWLYSYQEERKVASSTMEYYRGIINSFFVWAQQEGYLTDNPVVTVKPIKCEKKQRKALTRVELEYLRSACETPREEAIIETFFSTGCRVSELINLKKEDIDWNEKSVHVLGKGNKHRTCYINAKCEVALKQYLNEREDDNEYLFVSTRKPYSKLSKSGMEKIVNSVYERVENKVGKKVTPHILRHTTATLALQSGMKITNISTMFGHSKVETTMRYAETNQQEIHSEHTRCVI